MFRVAPAPAVARPCITVVLPGLARVAGPTRAGFARAQTPWLDALDRLGRSARRAPLAPHLRACEATALASILADAPAPGAIDPAALAASHADVGGAGPSVLVDVLHPGGTAVGAFEVARTVEHLRRRNGDLEVNPVPSEPRIVLVGSGSPDLHPPEGVELRRHAAGWVPRPTTAPDAPTFVGARGSTGAAVARLLGLGVHVAARVEPRLRTGDRDERVVSPGSSARGWHPGIEDRRGLPLAALRAAALRALVDGTSAHVVVEARDLLLTGPGRRASHPDQGARALERLDRDLIGPIAAAAPWLRATVVVTCDVVRDEVGDAVSGDVPFLRWDAGSGRVPGRPPVVPRAGTAPPPVWDVQGRPDLPRVVGLRDEPRAADLVGPRRFERAPLTVWG